MEVENENSFGIIQWAAKELNLNDEYLTASKIRKKAGIPTKNLNDNLKKEIEKNIENYFNVFTPCAKII